MLGMIIRKWQKRHFRKGKKILVEDYATIAKSQFKFNPNNINYIAFEKLIQILIIECNLDW
jgi:hypothetical protein